MTKSGDDDIADENELPGDWAIQPVEDSTDVYRAWRSDELGMTVEAGRLVDEKLVVEVKQDVAVDGYESAVSTHFATCDGAENARARAVDFMGGASDGSYSVEPLCAFESEEMVDFVCVYVDDLDQVGDLDTLREIVRLQLGDDDATVAGEEAVDLAEQDELDVTKITIDVFPKLKPDVVTVEGGGA